MLAPRHILRSTAFAFLCSGGAAFAAGPTPAATPVELPSSHLFSPLTTLMVERLKISGASVSAVRVEPLRSRIVLNAGARVHELAASRLCPDATVEHRQVVLHCRSTRFTATLDAQAGILTLVELRGLPWRAEEGVGPTGRYDPDKLGRKLACPGGSLAEDAECAFEAGDYLRAFKSFGRVTGPAEGFALLRMGDVAERLDDPERALLLYAQTLTTTLDPNLLALARLRRCELNDECSAATWTAAAFPPLIQDEVRLRVARYLAFHGRFPEMLAMFGEDLTEDEQGSRVCLLNRALCRQLLQGALEKGDVELQARALETYLAIPDRQRGEGAVDLACAAAETANRLGVPRFGAHVLAAIFPAVSASRQGDHLLRTAELYQADGDQAHADAILEFARTKLSRGELQTEAWRHVLTQPRLRRAVKPFSPDKLERSVQADREVAQAIALKASLKLPKEAAR